MRWGFSLVELSIVLVILGLLTGGILAGQSLIRASELRAVTKEYDTYATALRSFRDRYFAIPGDFRDATRFWGRQTTDAWCVSNHGLIASGSPGACDGNGNGLLYPGSGASETGEAFQFWRHLANAGLIEGSYSGLAGAGGIRDNVIGSNAPASRLSNTGWSVYYSASTAGNSAQYALEYLNFFNFGAQYPTRETFGAALRPEEAWNVDTKIDDGMPGLGKVIARYWNNACATGGADETDLVNSRYNLALSNIQCAFYFKKAF